MNYTLTEPCDDCPFREGTEHAYTDERLEQFASGEFPCHKTAKLREGVGHPVGTPLVYGHVTDRWNIDREFRPLWESINGPGSWTANPLVWVIGLRLLKALGVTP
jgi:hypothetical protein